ncbi:MAG: hypothetical protein H6971_03675 [Gammaproteobacteria bacterium]|nr:hypothetical protein [Gammaproteobacteria bacterium]
MKVPKKAVVAPPAHRRTRLWRTLRGYGAGRMRDLARGDRTGQALRQQCKAHLGDLLSTDDPAPDGSDPIAVRGWAEAMARYRWPPAWLQRRYREHARVARLMLGAAALSGLMGGYRLGLGDPGGTSASLGALLLFLAVGLPSAYRCGSIRQRRLGAFALFIRRPLAWWPPTLPDDYQP